MTGPDIAAFVFLSLEARAGVREQQGELRHNSWGREG